MSDLGFANHTQFKIARIEKDLTQEDLSTKVGVSRQTLSLIERSLQSPSLEVACNIAKVLEKSINQIFYTGGMFND